MGAYSFIKQEKLAGTCAYLDDITVCGMTQAEHDVNLEKFMKAAEKKNIVYNEGKCVFSTTRLSILGYVVEDSQLRPEPERLRPLRELAMPRDVKSIRRIIGFFAYYSQWIRDFSTKIRPLSVTNTFPASNEAEIAFQQLKRDIEESYYATLNQAGRPVAFFSRTLQGSVTRYASVEKKAQAIIETVRHWKHCLTGKHFFLKTDQQAVSYMFDKRKNSKIKNDKIMRWRMGYLGSISVSCTAQGRKTSSDTFSRSYCSSTGMGHRPLLDLHESLCHPGVTHMYHFVKS